MASGQRPPNRQLAWARLQRGWSHEELRIQIVRAMKAENETDTGLSRNTVRRWESGERAPEPRYRKYLVIVFGMPADQLGLLDPEELAMRPVQNDDGIEVLWRLVSMFSGRGDMDRETFLKGLLAFGATPLLPSLLEEKAELPSRLAHQINSSGGLSTAVVEDFEAITVSQRHLYWSTAPLPLYTSVKSHVTLGQELLKAGGPQAVTRRLAVALSESAMLAGRIAFFDLKRAEPAEADLTLALQATEEAGDHALAAAVLAHVSFLAAHNGDASAARATLAAAVAHSRHHTGPMTRAWLSCVEAEVMASVNDPATSLRALSRAEGLLPDEGEEPEWLDFFDASRFAGFAGHAHHVLGQPDKARAHLETSLAQLAPDAAKQKAVIYADLAATHIDDDAEAACTYAGQALDQLSESWYATGYDRVQQVRRQLTSSQQNRQVLELEERMRSMIGNDQSS
ncbi:helix-turn-helix transcriptional regulator [Kineosporia sp. J2-2]|uniref:Helix-turn-helix transcriptional regulator n=1 Tax=Kineosporia corallincola TaxID=2835133 RepID=A0ABS5TJH8_9ACTN|nr:helix-turn-helix transcriptional regulator [Kineosporia corallincola]MBT0771247.1 helix-turn-helix transcriptional regulator [Kineosporia corallincola]